MKSESQSPILQPFEAAFVNLANVGNGFQPNNNFQCQDFVEDWNCNQQPQVCQLFTVKAA
jgi:hypothetical protein